MSSQAIPTLIAALHSLALPAAPALAPYDPAWSLFGHALTLEQADSVL